MSEDYNQLSMFQNQPDIPPVQPDDHDDAHPYLRHDTPLEEAARIYLNALELEGFSHHTVKAFRSDLNLLINWSGYSKPIGTFATEDLNKFLHWMLIERGKPCSPKTYARRVTTLKNFFGYLHSMDAIRRDPSLAVIQKPVKSALPEILFDAELKEVLEITSNLRDNPEKPDARPHLLVTLLLQTGMKKSEAMNLHPRDVVLRDPENPVIWVRYANPQMRYKERKIPVRADWITIFNEYMRQRQPPDKVFDCTARNLEYVLRDVASAAAVASKKVSFEGLRWTCAVRDFRDGMPPEELRQKLGLSRISWRETSSKLEELLEILENPVFE
jgi:site-specific recombinase XerD